MLGLQIRTTMYILDDPRVAACWVVAERPGPIKCCARPLLVHIGCWIIDPNALRQSSFNEHILCFTKGRIFELYLIDIDGH